MCTISYRFSTLVAMVFALAIAGQANANFVANGSFEENKTSYFTALDAAHWISWAPDGGVSGVFAPAKVNNGHTDWNDTNQFANGAPDGTQVAYVIGSKLEQDTHTNSVVGTTYVLDLWVGQQYGLTGADANPQYSIFLKDGSKTIATVTGDTTAGIYNEVTISGVGLGGDLSVELFAYGQQEFDKVSLDSITTFNSTVPEPSSLSLLAFGIFALVATVIRKRHATSIC